MTKGEERFYRYIEGTIIGILSGVIVLIFGQKDLSTVCKPFVYSILSGLLGYGFYLKFNKKKHIKLLFYLSLLFLLLALYLFYLGIKC
ncbi:hypothetical protein HYX05_00630 [Candidatus Woesearchaeota archaeon]|nr:hypothetical protein [Candidatus Woesearchaeota archaeon]